MSQAVKQNLFGLVVAAALAAVLGFAVVHAARGEPCLRSSKASSTSRSTLQDRDTDQRYAKLVL